MNCRPFPMRTPDAVRALRQMCLEIIQPNFVMAELGCYYGESTVEFARHAKTVFAIDPWAESYLESEDLQTVGRNVSESMADVEKFFDELVEDRHNIRKIKRRHEDAVDMFGDGSLDLVYCDTIHSEEATASAISLWEPKIRRGGYVSGHDYLDLFPGVKTAVDAKSGDALLLWGDGNWAYRRLR